jgi:hypothetical protein
MSSESPRRGRESAGSPLGSTAAIIIAIVAVVAGFLILRQINDDDDTGTTDPSSDLTVAPDETTLTDETTGVDETLVGDTGLVTIPTTIPVDTTTSTIFTTIGAIVVVANASTVNGAAGQLTTALTGKEFDLVAAANSTVKLDVSKIMYDPANAQAQAVAQSIGTLMAVTDVVPIESPAPVEGGTLQGGATVLVLLGSDKASKTLDQMSLPDTGTTTTVVAGETTTSV